MEQHAVFVRHNNLHIRYKPSVAGLLDACRHPTSLLTDPSCQLLKQDQATTVGRIHLAGVNLVIKQYHLRNPGYAIKRSVRHTRAHNCWHMAHKLQTLGIATPSPVAIIEERFGPLRRRSWLLYYWLDGDICRDFLQQQGLTPTTRPICQAIIKLLHTLQTQRISHGDLKATNLLLTPSGPALLDLDASHYHRPYSLSWHHRQRRDCQRFLRNWQQHPELLEFFSRQLSQ